MAPSSKTKEQQHKEDNVVKLVTQGKVSGQFSQHGFRKLSPLVRVPLKDIISEELLAAGHIFLGFIKSGRYILSYTKVESEESDSEADSDSEAEAPLSGYNYTLFWWEFNLHSKLKLVQQVKLFADVDAEEHDLLSLHVCEWPNDDSNIAIFGFDAQRTSTNQLMISLRNDHVISWCYWFVTIAPNPPSKPCSNCSATTTPTGIGGGKCLEHGYALHGQCYADCPCPLQPALQLKKDKVILLKGSRLLVACAIYPCPAGEQSQSCQMLYAKRAAPPSGQPSSSASMLPQGSAEGTHPSNGSTASSSSSSSSPTLPSSSSQEADLYVDYKRLHYHLPQPGAEGENVRHCFLRATDLKGRAQKLVTGGPHDEQSLCVEEMALDIGHLLKVLLHGDAVWDPQSRSSGFDFVILEMCPETDKVLIGIALFWKREERNMRVSWDLSTGLCSVIGVSDLTNDLPYKRRHYGRAVKSHRKSCVDTVMECSVPESSSHHVNVIDADDDLPKSVLSDTERCTWVTTR